MNPSIIPEFRSWQADTGAVVSGYAAFHFFNGSSSPTRDIHIYVDHQSFKADSFVPFLASGSGFVYSSVSCCSIYGGQDETVGDSSVERFLSTYNGVVAPLARTLKDIVAREGPISIWSPTDSSLWTAPDASNWFSTLATFSFISVVPSPHIGALHLHVTRFSPIDTIIRFPLRE